MEEGKTAARHVNQRQLWPRSLACMAATHAQHVKILSTHLRALRSPIGSAGTMSDAEQALLEVRGQ